MVTLTALGIGIALAGAPGPVQAVIVSEAGRGGVRRGLLAVLGASAGFGSLLLPTALGLAGTSVSPLLVDVLRLLGGGFLLVLAVGAFRDARTSQQEREINRPGLGPSIRGLLAVVLNPGAWLFIGAVAAPLFAEASRDGGAAAAAAAAVALMAGAASGDAALAVAAGLGLRRAGPRAVWVHRGLAVVLAGIGAWLLVDGVLRLVGAGAQ